jgi:hypothetical protein
MIVLSPLVLGQVAFVEGTSECPSATTVEQRVRGILGMKAEERLEERALLSREGERLQVVVRTKDGGVLGQRLLDMHGSCEDVEKTVAVVVATWISDVHPEFVAALPPSSATTTTEPEPEAEPSPAIAARAPSPAPTTPASPLPVPVAPSTPTKRARRWEVAAAAGVDISGERVSALGALGVRWMPERSGLGAGLAAVAMTPRTETLSMGSVSYWRWPLVAGPVLRAPLGGGHLDFHVGGALGWVHAKGHDFQDPQTRDTVRGGGLVSIRGAYGAGRWQGFAEVSGLGWGKTEVFVRRGDDEPSKALPVLELFLTAGAAVGL